MACFVLWGRTHDVVVARTNLLAAGSRKTTGPETRGPEDHGTRGPQEQRTAGPEDQETRGPRDQRTRDHGTTDHGTKDQERATGLAKLSKTQPWPNLPKRNSGPGLGFRV